MRKLILVTSQFPYGCGETFIENEIKYLAEAFDVVYIYASQIDKDTHMSSREVPDNVYVFGSGYKDFSKLNYLNSLFQKKVWDEISQKCTGTNFLGKVASCCYFDQSVKHALLNIDSFIKTCKIKDDSITIYSYWLNIIGMTALNISNELREKGHGVKTVARTHGFDLYEERAYLNYQPFQEQMIKDFDHIFPCSDMGSKYLKEKYPEYADKIETSYLGVPDCLQGEMPFLSKEKFSIVSCSNVIPLKRVSKIAEALQLISDCKIEWTHFGDGELLEDVKQKVERLPDNISIRFPGRVANSDIYKFYNENNVNLFINVSSSEGLPVSIMEAISFGIPIIATDVGGTSEIVTNGINGFLLPEDFSIYELEKLIRKIINMNAQDYCVMCQNARDIYRQRFCAKKNYPEFSLNLKEIGEKV